MAKVQKVYTREFKEQAVPLAQTSGKSIAQVARELAQSGATTHLRAGVCAHFRIGKRSTASFS